MKVTIEQVRVLIPENAAVMYQGEGVPRSDMNTLVRTWPSVLGESATIARDYLMLYASADNTDASDTVDQPMVGGIAQPGLWYNLGVRLAKRDDGAVLFYQVLKKNFDLSVPFYAHEETGKKVYTYRIDGQITEPTFETSFASLQVQYEEVLGEDPEGIQELSYQQGRDDGLWYGQYTLEVGVDLTGDWEGAENGCFFNITRKQYINSATDPALPANSQGIRYRKGTVLKNADGTFTTYMEKIERIAKTFSYTEELASSGTTDATRNLGASSLTTLANEVGHVKRRTAEMEDDCTFNERISDKTVTDQPATEWEKSAARAVSRAKHTEGDALTEPNAPAAGTVVRAVQEPTDSGKARTVLETTTVTDQEASEWERSASKGVVRQKHTEGTALTDPGTQTAGTIVRAVQEPTDSGKARTVLETTTVTDQEASEWEKSAAKSVVRLKHTEGTALTEPDAPAAGTVVRAVQEPTDSGKARTILETTTVTSQTDNGSFYTRRGQVQWWTGRNATAAEYGAAVTASGIDVEATGNDSDNSHSKRVNEYGRIDYDIVLNPTAEKSTAIDRDYIEVGWTRIQDTAMNLGGSGYTFTHVYVQTWITNNSTNAQAFCNGGTGFKSVPSASGTPSAKYDYPLGELAGYKTGIEHSISGGWKRAIRVYGGYSS